MDRRRFIGTVAAATPALLTVSATGQEKQSQNPKVAEIRSRIQPITASERGARIEKARQLMTEQKIGSLLFDAGIGLKYYTGINWGRSERLFAMILPRDGEPHYIAPKFEESRAREQVGNARLFLWEEDESPYELVRQILAENQSLTRPMAVEETTRAFVTESMRKEIPNLTIVSGTPITAECRAVKSEPEIALMQIADDITAEVFKSAVTRLREGMTEREFGSVISRLFSEFGVNGGALVLFGKASAHPHGLEEEHVLREGDIVLIDGGCSVEGYASDITRTTVFGKPTDKMKAVFDLVRKAQSSALSVARPGIPAEEIDAAARKVIVDAGYGPDYKYFTHRLGHGIGLEGHEWYYLVRGNRRQEKAGETHSNEPGIYIVGEFGMRLEDEMLITGDGAKLLLPQATSLDVMF